MINIKVLDLIGVKFYYTDKYNAIKHIDDRVRYDYKGCSWLMIVHT